MGSIHKLSSQVIEYAERLSEMADAAEGKHRRRGLGARWLLLPATGAAAYALVRSKTFSRQAKEVVDEAKTRASELPNDLVSRVRQVAERTPSENGRQERSATTRKSNASRKSGSRKAKSTASASR